MGRWEDNGLQPPGPSTDRHASDEEMDRGVRGQQARSGYQPVPAPLPARTTPMTRSDYAGILAGMAFLAGAVIIFLLIRAVVL
jgi:hypothetical protein